MYAFSIIIPCKTQTPIDEPVTPLSTIKIPVVCAYELHPWANNVLFPVLTKFNSDLAEMKRLIERATHQRTIDLYNKYAYNIEAGIKKLQEPSQARTDFMKTQNAQKQINDVIKTLQEIVNNLHTIARTVGPIDITQLNQYITAYHKDYTQIEEGFEFLQRNKVVQMEATVSIPPKFKGWVDVRPFCNKKLTEAQQLTIKSDETTYKRKETSR